MKTTTASAKVIDQQSLKNSVPEQKSLNHNNTASISTVNSLDETEFELERIMLEELAQGLPSDISMADF